MRLFVCLTLILMSFTLKAGGWSQAGQIIEVYNHGYTVMVKLSGTGIDYSDGQCASSAYYAINVSDSTAFKIQYSQILMAHASGMTIRFYLDGSTCVGQGNNYQRISTLRTYKN